MQYPKLSLFVCVLGLLCSAVGLMLLNSLLVFVLGLIPTIVLWVDPLERM